MSLGSLQENLLCILCYDDKHGAIVRNSVQPNLYSGPYMVIALRCYDYIDKYKKSPRDHIADLLSDKLQDDKEGDLYQDILINIRNTSENGINIEYVLHTLDLFIKRQSLRTVSVDLAKSLQRDTEDSLEQAWDLINKATKQSLKLFDPGTRLGDKSKALKFLEIANESFPTGIEELDKRGFGPTRKELWLLIANTKGGKSWSLMHLGKMAIRHRLKVVHITLEMSEARTSQRYFQSLFAVAKRPDKYPTTKFRTDELGRITGFDDVQLTPKYTLQDPDIRAKLEGCIDKWALRQLDNIYIKEFPTGQLTIHQLKAYLDNLEATQSFVPDLLVVDYPDLMKLDKADFRLSLDEVYKELRGLAVERNIALAVVSQSHRDAAKAKVVRAANVSEAYSKIAHADCVITMTSTDGERKLGLARLFVDAGRNDEDKITILISQQYGMGSFVVSSHLMPSDYWTLIGEEEN